MAIPISRLKVRGCTGSVRAIWAPQLCPQTKLRFAFILSKPLSTDGNTCVLQVLCSSGVLSVSCTGNPGVCSGPCLPSLLNAHWHLCSATSKKTDGKCTSKKVIKQTHPYPIMPYALLVLNRKFLISLYRSNSFIPPTPPLWKDDMTREV